VVVTLWFMRVLEQDDGQWLCRFARQDFGTLPDLDAALWHLTAATVALGGRELFRYYVHWRDGSIEERLGTDPLPDWQRYAR
jgi:hypothetical protein